MIHGRQSGGIQSGEAQPITQDENNFDCLLEHRVKPFKKDCPCVAVGKFTQRIE